MKRLFAMLLILVLLLCGCRAGEEPIVSAPTEEATQPVSTAPVATAPTEATEPETTESTEPETTVPETTEATEPETTVPETTEATEPEQPKPAHSELYIPDISVEDVITYFNEVCLDAEFVNNGDASLLQRWEEPIYYSLNGAPTEEDYAILATFTSWLNSIPGFPGIYEAQSEEIANLQIHFCTADDLISILGDNFYGCDGGVTFWYHGDNAIYDATICIQTGIDQYTRNSVIQEEIYNGLGPVQDTDLRGDSLIYSGYTTPQEPTRMDMLIMELLYHPSLRCGMNSAECAEVIRLLYY